MKRILIGLIALGSMSAFAKDVNYEFLPTDCSLSRKDAFELTQSVMSQRGVLADTFKEEKLSKDKIRAMDSDQLFKTHTEYSNLEFRVHQAAQEFAHYIQVQCKRLPAWK